MLIIIILVLFASVIIFDWHTLLKKTNTGEKIIYFSIMLISFSILMLHTLSIKIPSPTAAIEFAVGALFKIE